jgi:hypothetical protein
MTQATPNYAATQRARKVLSQPMADLLKRGQITPKEHGFLSQIVVDMGCGKGSDARILWEDHNRYILGYDPYNNDVYAENDMRVSKVLPYRVPQNDFARVLQILKWDQTPALITCNFVLNVMESVHARRQLVWIILSMAKEGDKVYFSVRGRKDIEQQVKDSWKEYNDGYLTTRNTFQRGFTKDELKDFILSCFADANIVFQNGNGSWNGLMIQL